MTASRRAGTASNRCWCPPRAVGGYVQPAELLRGVVMLLVRGDSANELFLSTCKAVLARGQPTAPRGMKTVEVLGAHLCLSEPRRRFVDLPPVRIPNPAFAVAEAVWILSGSDEPWIYTYNQRLRSCADQGQLLGAYGPRLRRWRSSTERVVDQLDHVRRLLLREPDSRRAVIQLFDPGRDHPDHGDVPCTLNYRFYLRDRRLHMHTTMRSQDAWLGFCYDIFTTTLIQELMAGWLGVEVGEYHHHIDSLHLYSDHLAEAARLPARVQPSPAMPPLAVAWSEFDPLLARVIGGEDVPADGWAEFATLMRSYRLWKSADRAGARHTAGGRSGQLVDALHRWYDHLERHDVNKTRGR